MSYQVKTRVFEGPLDLLLQFLRTLSFGRNFGLLLFRMLSQRIQLGLQPRKRLVLTCGTILSLCLDRPLLRLQTFMLRLQLLQRVL